MSVPLANARRANGASVQQRSAAGLLHAQTLTPTAPAGMVPRPELVRRLVDAREEVLALLVAPPGYGKSSLLTEWARSDARAFLWLGLCSDAELTATPRRPALGPAWADNEAMAALAAKTTRGAAQIATTLVRSLAARHQEFVLVIDDADAFAPEVLRRIVEPMLQALPVGATVAVTSRTEPALPVGRLRAHRAIVEVRMADFAMTAADAGSLLRGAGVQLDFSTVHGIARRTEGWPAAIYLESLEDAEHQLGEYVREEVLSGLSPSLTNFALRTAVLEELT